ncbi:MAG TPA: DUF4031 domain-containing protein, partial [Micromonosporaceae bacterium]|nr:DUF4031 domain-containing protein [Micromonosporaceae bacterium]
MIYVDRPAWPARGRLWSHLVSDVSYAELHAFAELLGAPRRGFERDHYDIPAERFPVAVWLGARVVPGREIVARLSRAGLRVRKSGQRVQFAGQVG